MNSLKKPIAALTLGAALAVALGGATAAPTDRLPAPPKDVTAGLIITEGVSPSPNGLGYARIPGLFNAAQVEGWGNVDRWQLIYLWKSAVEVPFEFQPAQGYRTEQFCSRLRLFRADHSVIENTTFLCTVANRGTPTEVWSFGNRDPAQAICELKAQDVAAIDRSPPLAEGAVAPATATKRPVSAGTRK